MASKNIITDGALTQLITKIKSALSGKSDTDHNHDSAYLKLSGGTMTGDIAMGGKSVTGVAAPSADTDAANKAYVDDKADIWETVHTW